MDIDDMITKNLDAIFDKYGITENRDAIKDDIYHDVILEVWWDGRQTGRDTYWKTMKAMERVRKYDENHKE